MTTYTLARARSPHNQILSWLNREHALATAEKLFMLIWTSWIFFVRSFAMFSHYIDVYRRFWSASKLLCMSIDISIMTADGFQIFRILFFCSLKLTLFIFFDFAWATTNQIINTHKNSHSLMMVQHAARKFLNSTGIQQQREWHNSREKPKSNETNLQLLNVRPVFMKMTTDKIAKVIQFHLLRLDRHNRSVVTYSFVSEYVYVKLRALF